MPEPEVPTLRLIFGAGGHGRVVRDALRSAGIEVAGFLDDGREGEVDGLPVLGGRGWLMGRPSCTIYLGIGSNAVRRRVGQDLLAAGHQLGAAIHERAWISPSASVGAGAVIFAGAVVNSCARIGVGAIVNSTAVVEHDCEVGDWAHLSPGARLGGEARVGEEAWVGIGGCVLPGIRVGDRATLGAGAVAVRPIPDGAVWVGVPARSLR